MKLDHKISEKLTKLGVVALYEFGSRPQGLSGPLSDFDFAVLMNKDGYKRGGKFYNTVYDLLSPLCARTLKNDVIDIIFLRDVPLELRFHVVRRGVVLFETDSQVRLDFEEKTVLEYCDYRPILDEFDAAVLASI